MTPAPPKVPCELCEGSGRLTADELMQSEASVMREIQRDRDEGITSRAEQALLSGRLVMMECDACGGAGEV